MYITLDTRRVSNGTDIAQKKKKKINSHMV